MPGQLSEISDRSSCPVCSSREAGGNQTSTGSAAALTEGRRSDTLGLTVRFKTEQGREVTGQMGFLQIKLFMF